MGVWIFKFIQKGGISIYLTKRMLMIRKILQMSLIVTLCLLSNIANSQEISKVTVKEYIVKHSLELGIDPALGLSIAKLESNFVHNKKGGSGAVGVFQIMPDTARRMGFNPYYLSENIRGGLNYYKMMHQKFGSVELALAAYNAGPGNVARYGGVPPFSETKMFVNRIQQEYKLQKANPDPVIGQVKNKQAAAKKATSVAKPKPVSAVKPAVVAKPVSNAPKNVNAVKKPVATPVTTPAVKNVVKPVVPAAQVVPAKKVAPVENVSTSKPVVQKTVVLNPTNTQFQVISTPMKADESQPKMELGDAIVNTTPTTS